MDEINQHEHVFHCELDDTVRVGGTTWIKVAEVSIDHVVLQIDNGGETSTVVIDISEHSSDHIGTNHKGEPVMTDMLSENNIAVDGNSRGTLEYLLLGDLVELLEEGYDEENRRWLLVVLDGLLDAIPTEGRKGRIAGVRDIFPRSPRLQTRLTRLELEHDELISQLRRLRNRVAWRLSLLDEVAAEVCKDLQTWLESFMTFCNREARMERQTTAHLDAIANLMEPPTRPDEQRE